MIIHLEAHEIRNRITGRVACPNPITSHITSNRKLCRLVDLSHKPLLQEAQLPPVEMEQIFSNKQINGGYVGGSRSLTVPVWSHFVVLISSFTFINTTPQNKKTTGQVTFTSAGHIFSEYSQWMNVLHSLCSLNYCLVVLLYQKHLILTFSVTF